MTSQLHVVAGIDGSEQALAAVRAAAVAARHRDQPLRIVHAFIWAQMHVDVRPVSPDLPGTGLRHHAEDLLAEASAEAEKAAPGVPVSTALIDGAATPVLLGESRQASLLVLGDRGLGGVSGLVVGSVAVHTAAHAYCPVLVVRGAEPAAGPVVVGIDGSETSGCAVDLAFPESVFRKAPLVPVLAWNETAYTGALRGRASGELTAAVQESARRTLDAALAGRPARFPGVTVEPELIRGHPRQVLVERSRAAQLVVVGSRGRDTFKGLVLGSVSQTLLYHAACPVLVARDTLHRRQEES